MYKLSHHLVKKKKYGDMCIYAHRLSWEGGQRQVTHASAEGEQEN